MNERIKELAEAAYREVVCNPLNDFISRELVDQRFAELIIEAVCYDIMNLHGCDPERVQMVAWKFGVNL
jgi:hypothetical protein